MAGYSLGHKKLWQYSHSASIFFAVLLFTAGFLCVLLWTNDLVHTGTSASDPATSTFTQFSPAVSTFSITYNVVRTQVFLFVSIVRRADSLSTGHLWNGLECHLLRNTSRVGT